MQKKSFYWMMAAILICGLTITSVSLSSCEKANAQEDNPAPKVESTELIRTSQSWDGVELPDYFQGRPELVAVKYVFPAGQKLGWHHHVAMNYGVLVQGKIHHRSGRQDEGGALGGGPVGGHVGHRPPRREPAAPSPSSSTCSTSRRRMPAWRAASEIRRSRR